MEDNVKARRQSELLRVKRNVVCRMTTISLADEFESVRKEVIVPCLGKYFRILTERLMNKSDSR